MGYSGNGFLGFDGCGLEVFLLFLSVFFFFLVIMVSKFVNVCIWFCPFFNIFLVQVPLIGEFFG